ncbi:hypothetical protein GCM10009133_09020 [Cocleimonas flava]|uniref:Uncharacterized protein n=1 Tax=Cocleimonas flava TaxID=634765 RepID=A0A4R1F3X0_9GAMM|nr:hypothetical protein EV695_1772 [Cocleimonas flava]
MSSISKSLRFSEITTYWAYIFSGVSVINIACLASITSDGSWGLPLSFWLLPVIGFLYFIFWLLSIANFSKYHSELSKFKKYYILLIIHIPLILYGIFIVISYI